MIIGNEAAYPLSPDGNKELGYNTGLTIRQYFAAMAMQGLLASYAGVSQNPNPESLAKKAIEYVDALINELNKQS